MRFDVLWRPRAGAEATLFSVRHHFDPPPLGPDRFKAVPFEFTANTAATMTIKGDALVLRFVLESGDPGALYLPNGDGNAANGRDPSLTLPAEPVH
jgi:hypothetical protein